MVLRQRSLALLSFLTIALTTSGCLPYIYHERSSVLIEGVDVDQTLDVAERELEDGGFGSVLTVWAVRDQEITPLQASRISDLYFQHIQATSRDAGFFDIWHLTWAISNFYRLGDDAVRTELESAFRDASLRVGDLDSDMVTSHFSDDRIFMGDAHAIGRNYARSRIVVPGNELYVQSATDVR